MSGGLVAYGLGFTRTDHDRITVHIVEPRPDGNDREVGRIEYTREQAAELALKLLAALG